MVRAKINIKISITALLLAIAFIPQKSFAAILFVGGETFDFPVGALPVVSGTAAHFRSGFARHAIYHNTSSVQAASNPFSTGAVTSVWLSVRIYNDLNCAGHRFIGLGKSGTSNGIWLATSTAQTKLRLVKYDGSSTPVLANEAGNSIPLSTQTKVDMQVISYGATGTVNVYTNGSTTPALTYTGDLTAGGNTSLDDVRIQGNCGAGWGFYYSEIIVSDTDTRRLSLVTMAPTTAGTANQWTGTETDISEATTNDNTVISTSTSGNIYQCNVTDLPSGSYSIQSVTVKARASTSGAGATGISLGVRTSSTNHQPAANSLVGAWGLIEKEYSVNPVSSSPWTSADVNGLELSLQAAP